MKRILVLAVLLAATMAWAQNGFVNRGAEIKRFNYAANNDSRIFSVDDQGILAVVPDTKITLGAPRVAGDFHLGLFDMDGNAKKDIVVPSMDYSDCLFNIVEGNLYLLATSLDGLHRVVVDLASFSVTSDELMKGYDSPQLPKRIISNERLRLKDLSIMPVLTIASSPNKEFAVMVRFGGQENVRLMTLLDNTFRPLWEKRDLDGSSMVRVTNDGTVYQLLAATQEKSFHTALKFMRIDADNEQEEVVVLPHGFEDIHFLNVIDNRIVASGLLTTEPEELKKRGIKRDYDRVIGIAYDFSTRRLSTDIQPLSSDALNVLNNVSNKSENRSGKSDCLLMCTGEPTSFGGVSMVLRNWVVEIYNQQTLSTTYKSTSTGVMLFAVDKEGKVKWQRPFRYAAYEPTNGPIRSMPKLLTQGDKSYLLLAEAKPAKVGYDILKPVSAFRTPGNVVFWTLFTVDAQSNVSAKSTLKSEKAMYGCSQLLKDNKLYIEYDMIIKGGFAEMEL